MKPIITYIRNKRKGSPETCTEQRRETGSDLSVMNSLSTQNGVQNGDQLIEGPSLCTSNNMSETEETAGDGAHLTVVEDTTSEKAINGSQDCENAAGNNTVTVKEDIVSSDNTLIAEENLSKSICSQENNSQASTETSRKKLLVLDVNGLLADIVPSAYVSDRYEPDHTISGKAVFKRPFCDEFLELCFRRFKVGVWSSRIKKNVNMAVNFLMGNEKDKLLFCWDQYHCTETDYTTVENDKKPLVLKELKKLWEKSEEDLPWQIGEYNASNTLLLDDSPYKALGNPPNTAIFPHTYQYMDKKDNSLGPGGSLYMYLEGLAEADDVQTYVKENPFGQEPITDKNPKWDFYLEVIESLTRTPKCSVKSENVISKSDPTYYRRKAEGVESGNSGDSVGKKDNEGNWVNNENNKEQNSMWRGRKRGRSPNGSQSPTRGKVWYPRDRTTPWIGRERHNVSHSMSHERYESRSRSPSYRRGGEFNGERMRVYNKAPPVEVCRAFMQGRCYRGANCWYLHHQPDMNIINNNNRGVGGGVKQQNQNVPASSNNINVNGRNETSPCVRKIRDSDEDIVVKDERTEQVCKFTNQVPPPQKISDNEECRDFSRGKCHRGESCMHRHISYRDECRDFISGKCHRGSSCVHLHNETDEIDGTRYSWSRQHVQHPVIPPPPQISPIPRNVYSRPNTIPAERPRSCNVYSRPNSIPERSLPVPQIPIPAILKEEVKRAAPYQPKPCYHFRRGKCAYGDRCHFAHVEFDRPRPPYLTKENLPFTSKGGQTEKTQELDMEEKVEVSKTSTTQLCDEENPKPCVPPVTDDVRGEKETQGN